MYDRLVLPAWVFVLPYLILAWDGFKSAIYAAASMLWERYVLLKALSCAAPLWPCETDGIDPWLQDRHC